MGTVSIAENIMQQMILLTLGGDAAVRMMRVVVDATKLSTQKQSA